MALSVLSIGILAAGLASPPAAPTVALIDYDGALVPLACFAPETGWRVDDRVCAQVAKGARARSHERSRNLTEAPRSTRCGKAEDLMGFKSGARAKDAVFVTIGTAAPFCAAAPKSAQPNPKAALDAVRLHAKQHRGDATVRELSRTRAKPQQWQPALAPIDAKRVPTPAMHLPAARSFGPRFTVYDRVALDVNGDDRLDHVFSVFGFASDGAPPIGVLLLARNGDPAQLTVLETNPWGLVRVKQGDCVDLDGDGVSELLVRWNGSTQREFTLGQFKGGKLNTLADLTCPE